MTVVEILKERDRRGRSLFRTTKSNYCNLGGKCMSWVPRDFVSNLGTIPRGFYWLIAPSDNPMPFIHHDFNSNENSDPRNLDDDPHNDVPHASDMSRWMADAILYEMMVRDGQSAWKCWLVWGAVRFYARLKGIK